MAEMTFEERVLELQRTVGANVRRIRLARGMTQRELAGRCGLNAGYISRLERGKCNAQLSRIEAIADALEVPGWLLFARR